MSWFMSRPCVVDNLIHAAQLDAAQIAAQRSWLLPVLHLSIEDVVEAIARWHGREVLTRVSYQPDRALQTQFASYPPLLCPTSEAAGFHNDGSVDQLVRRALEPI
jgi:hypothetical protein